jgi:hypothetical protein
MGGGRREGQGGRRHAPQKRDPVPIAQDAGWASDAKNFDPPKGLQPRTIWPMVSRFTDYATTVATCKWLLQKPQSVMVAMVTRLQNQLTDSLLITFSV